MNQGTMCVWSVSHSLCVFYELYLSIPVVLNWGRFCTLQGHFAISGDILLVVVVCVWWCVCVGGVLCIAST